MCENNVVQLSAQRLKLFPGVVINKIFDFLMANNELIRVNSLQLKSESPFEIVGADRSKKNLEL